MKTFFDLLLYQQGELKYFALKMAVGLSDQMSQNQKQNK